MSRYEVAVTTELTPALWVKARFRTSDGYSVVGVLLAEAKEGIQRDGWFYQLVGDELCRYVIAPGETPHTLRDAPATTFAPDERPFIGEFVPTNGGHELRTVDLTPPPAPFTPEQEKRLREIAWEAAAEHARFDSLSRYGKAVEAMTVREQFLSGGGK